MASTERDEGHELGIFTEDGQLENVSAGSSQDLQQDSDVVSAHANWKALRQVDQHLPMRHSGRIAVKIWSENRWLPSRNTKRPETSKKCGNRADSE